MRVWGCFRGPSRSCVLQNRMPDPRKHCSCEALMPNGANKVLRHSSCCGDEVYRQCSTTMLRRTKKMVRPRMSGYARAMSTSSVARLPRLTAPAALTVSKAHLGPAVLVDKLDLGGCMPRF